MAINILDKIDLRQLGENLQQARKQRGMTQAEAAKIIDTSRPTMVAIEKGDRKIKPKELIKLARTYGYSVSDFVRPRPPIEPFQVQFRAVYQRSEAQQDQIEPYILRWQELCQNYLELEQIMKSPLPKNYPDDYTVDGMPIETTAEAIANQERQRLGLGDSPINRLRDILETAVGLRIFCLPLPPKYSEMYSYNEQLGGCMAINANHPPERRRWSLAHGYLHFLAHRRTSILDFEGQYKRLPHGERLAETFPKYFLMPTSSLLKQFNARCNANGGKFTPTDLFTLAHYYGVSVEAFSYRLEEMKILPSGTWNNLRERGIKVRKVQQELKLDAIPQRGDMTPIHYQHLAIEALDQGLITQGQFANFLQVNHLEARRIADQLREYSTGIGEEMIDFDLRQV